MTLKRAKAWGHTKEHQPGCEWYPKLKLRAQPDAVHIPPCARAPLARVLALLEDNQKVA
jgi:hypothetical protein